MIEAFTHRDYRRWLQSEQAKRPRLRADEVSDEEVLRAVFSCPPHYLTNPRQAVVASSGAGTTTPATASWSETTLAGSLAIAALAVYQDASGSITAPSGFTLAATANNGGQQYVHIYYATSGNYNTSGSVGSFALGGNKFWSLIIAEYTQPTGASPLDKAPAGNSGSSTTGTTSSTGTLTQASELLVAGIAAPAPITWSNPTNSFVQEANTPSTGDQVSVVLCDQIVSATTSLNCGITISSSEAWAAAIATFLITASSGSGSSGSAGASGSASASGSAPGSASGSASGSTGGQNVRPLTLTGVGGPQS
jgi:hypothetical protein